LSTVTPVEIWTPLEMKQACKLYGGVSFVVVRGHGRAGTAELSGTMVSGSPALAGPGLVWLGLAWPGPAWLGLAWLGLAWLGLALLGVSRLSPAIRC
jgi:hypothetical protein